MPDWLFHLPIVWMALTLFAATALVSGIIYAVVIRAAEGQAQAFKAVSPPILTPLGMVFSLLFGFLAAEVWNDSVQARTAVNREASALRSVVLLAASFPGEPEEHLRTFVREYIQDIVSREWPAMAHQRATLTANWNHLNEALRFTLSLTPRNNSQMVAQHELVVSLQSALDAHRQRIIISQSTIRGITWSVLILLAVILIFIMAVIHSDNRMAAALVLSVFTLAVTVCLVLLVAYNRPFTGEISVGPDLLLQVMP